MENGKGLGLLYFVEREEKGEENEIAHIFNSFSTVYVFQFNTLHSSPDWLAPLQVRSFPLGFVFHFLPS